MAHPEHLLRRALLCLSLLFMASLAAAETQPTLQVYKNPQCGCCGKWVEHMEGAGYSATTEERDDLSELKQDLGVAPQYQSCHTAKAGKYVFEGHVPAAQVKRFLANPPKGAIGLAVPGMPVGSPGMEIGDQHQDYQVLLLKSDGSSEVFAEIEHP